MQNLPRYLYKKRRGRGGGPAAGERAPSPLRRPRPLRPPPPAPPRPPRRASPLRFFTLFEKMLSGLRILATLYLAKSDHRWVKCISLKTINSDLQRHGGRAEFDPSGGRAARARVVPKQTVLKHSDSNKSRDDRLNPTKNCIFRFCHFGRIKLIVPG